MKVKIEDTCTACGLCVDTCPEVFEMGDELAQVIVDDVPAEHEDTMAFKMEQVSAQKPYL